MKTFIHILAQALIMIMMGSGVVWGQTHFRSHKTGNWNDVFTWEEGDGGAGWIWPASVYPSVGKLDYSKEGPVTILRDHKVTIRKEVVADELIIYGTLSVEDTLRIVRNSVGKEYDMTLARSIFPWPKSGSLEHCGKIKVAPDAKVDASKGDWKNHCTSTAYTKAVSLNSGSIENLGEIRMGIFMYSGGSVRGNPFLYDTSSAATLVLYQSADDTSMASIWPTTNGPTNITVRGNVTLNGTLTVRGTLEFEGSSVGINNLGEILIEGTFDSWDGSVTGNPLRYGANSSLRLSSGYVIDSGSLVWPATNGPTNVSVSEATLNSARTVTGTLDVSGPFHVVDTLTTNGTTKVFGKLDVAGTLINNGTLTGGIEVSGKLTNNGATQLNWFTIQPGGTVSGKDLVYDKDRRGTLVFNSSYTINESIVFWPRKNGPANVTVSRSINVTMNAARSVSDVLQIDGTLQVADTLTTKETRGGGTLQVDGVLIANGTTNVKTLLVAGTLTNTGTLENGFFSTCHVSGSLNNNGTTTSSGPFQVTGILTNKGTIQFEGLYPFRVAGILTNNGTMQINGPFQLDQGGTANGNDFTYGERGRLIFNNSSSPYDITSESVYWPSTNGPVDVEVQGAGGIAMNVARAVSSFKTAGSVRNASNLTVSGSVTINVGGFFDSSLVVYSGNATLFYNSRDSHNVSGEWGSGTSVGAGVPMHVAIFEGTTVNMPSSPRTCPGSLQNIGTLVLNTTPGANLSVGGNWRNTGTFEPNLRTVIFNGTEEQLVRGSRNTFDYLAVNNPAGIRIEGQPKGEEGDEEIDSVQVQQALTFTAGNIRLRLAHLILSGSVNGSSINRHVVTYEKGRVVRSIAADSSFQFPVGPTETSYNPLTITLAPGDTTETFSVRVDSTVASNDSLFVQRTWDIQEETPGDNHAALTFQWAGAEEGAKFKRDVSSTYLDNIELVRNSAASGTDPYIVSTTGGFPCTEFSSYTVGTSGTVAVKESNNGIITSFILSQNHPNPFNPSTTIRYAIPQAGEVTLKVYNLVGEEIATLVSEIQPAGEHTIRWNPVGLPSGVYFYRLEAEGFAQTKKLLLMK